MWADRVSGCVRWKKRVLTYKGISFGQLPPAAIRRRDGRVWVSVNNVEQSGPWTNIEPAEKRAHHEWWPSNNVVCSILMQGADGFQRWKRGCDCNREF